MPPKPNQFTFSPLQPLNLDSLLRSNHPPSLPQFSSSQITERTDSTTEWSEAPSTELTDDMSEWLGGIDISETGSGEEEDLSESQLVRLLGSDDQLEWSDDMSGVPSGSEPEYGSGGESVYPLESPSESPSEGYSDGHSESPSETPSQGPLESPSKGSEHSRLRQSPFLVRGLGLGYHGPHSALTRPVPTSLNGSREMTPPPTSPPPPPPGPWDEMDGIEFDTSIPAQEPARPTPVSEAPRSPWRDEAGDPFVGTGSEDDEEEEEEEDSWDGSDENTDSLGFGGGRSRAGSLAEEGSEFGDWIEGSWDDEHVLLVARLWGAEEEE
ncbi:hypothetical protein VE00_08250 [Pseudogymnoascus sp. WSF 3629]|nr:hypothetical protein VE00_08250 [Pseudogymnoascus sp. WSF 3629]